MLDNWSKRRPLNNIATVPIGNRQCTCCTIDDCCTTIYCLRSTTVLLLLLNRQWPCCTTEDCRTTTIYVLTVRLVLLNRQCTCCTLQDCCTTTIYPVQFGPPRSQLLLRLLLKLVSESNCLENRSRILVILLLINLAADL